MDGRRWATVGWMWFAGGFECSVPFDGTGWGCSADPRSDFDAGCCFRPTCESHSDCDDGLVCAPIGSRLGCANEIEDGETVCRCGAPPDGRSRPICVPPEAVEGEWCGTHWTQTECNAAASIELGPNDVQVCRWIEVHNVSIYDPAECRVDAPSSRCLTIQEGYDPGCPAQQCTSGDGSITLGGPMAHPLSGGTAFEVFGVDDVLCGSGTPVGNWGPASDASLGACAFTCE